MATLAPVPPETFESIKNVDIEQLSSLPESSIRAILPCLVRMSLCHPLDTSNKWTRERKKILQCLSGIEVVNSLVGLLSIDFHALELDAKKEQQMRKKLDGHHSESVLISQLDQGLALEFERSDAARKLRLLLSELLFISSQMKESVKGDFYHKNSELFESEVYLEEVSDVLCIAQAELPSLLQMTDVAEILLHVRNGAWLLSRLVANVPDTFLEVCVSLVTKSEPNDGDVGADRRTEALKTLCYMCPSQALVVRQLCVEHCKLPNLAISLTLQHHHRDRSTPNSKNGIVVFVSGLLFGKNDEVCKWFAQYIKSAQKKPESETMLDPLRQEILDQLIDLLPPGPAPSKISDDKIVHACVFIRLYCALKGVANLRLKDDEVQALVSLITCRPSPSVSAIRFICLSLCTLLTFPYLISSLENEHLVSDWIKWLVHEGHQFEKSSGGSASFGEMLLLFAIYFHTNQNSLIAQLVSSTLAVQGVLVKTNSLAKLRTIFIQEIFTEQVVAKHAVQVPVTSNLSTNITGCLPANCVHQLIKSRAFSKHKLPVKNWIYRQLRQCTTPLHPVVQPLIKAFVDSVIVVSSKSDLSNEPMTEKEIMDVFNDDKKTPQLLILYYVLYYQEIRLQQMKENVAWNRNVPSYSAHLLSTLPMKSLLQHAQKNQELYADLFPATLKLVVSHYPHLCLVEDWLDEVTTESTPSAALISLPNFPCTPENLSKAFSSTDHTQLLILLRQLSIKQAENLIPYINVITSNLHKLITDDTPRHLQEITKSVWLKCHTIHPTTVRVRTVNSLSRHPHLDSYTEDDLTTDPLIVLRCDQRIFRCPPFMEIILRILDAFLQASVSFLDNQMKIQANCEKPDSTAAQSQTPANSDQEELKSALVLAQQSAAIQILLEACLPKSDENTDCLLCDLREVRCLVCTHMHQMFIVDPTLAKLVHFQGYASELLPVTVAGIPSMHICLDFIPELLSQPHTDKRVFAIQLVSHLSLQYALPKSLGIARLAINVMTTLLKVLPSEERSDFFLATVPSVARICCAFPPLCDEVVSFLLQLGQICRSQLATFNNSGATLDGADHEELTSDLTKYSQLATVVNKTFEEICQSAALLKQTLH